MYSIEQIKNRFHEHFNKTLKNPNNLKKTLRILNILLKLRIFIKKMLIDKHRFLN